MRDYTGADPKFKVTGELVTPIEVRDDRWAPRVGSFYASSVKFTKLDGTPFLDFTFKGLDVAVQLHTPPNVSPAYMYIEFPNGITQDLVLEYQAVDLSNKPQTSALNILLDNLANVDDDYFEEDISGKPATGDVSPHKHRLSRNVAQLVSTQLVELFHKSPEELTSEYMDSLSTFLTKTSDTLIGDEKRAVLAINELARIYNSVYGKLNRLLLDTPGGLNTTATSFVPAINELVTAINTAAASSDDQFDFYGQLFISTDLSRAMTGGNKIWLVKAKLRVTGLFSDGATNKDLEAGDTVYYDHTLNRLVMAPLGVKLKSKQSKVDNTLVGDNKDVLSLINAQHTAVSELTSGFDLELLGFLANTATLVGAANGYYLVTGTLITITAPFNDGTTYKVLEEGDILTYSELTGKFTAGKLTDIPVELQASIDGELLTSNKTLVGAINEIYAMCVSTTTTHILGFNSYISSNITLAPTLGSSVWLVNAPCRVTANFVGSSFKDLQDGSIVIYNHILGKFISRSVDLSTKQPLIDTRLPEGSQDVLASLSKLNSDVTKLVGSNTTTFKGYLNKDIDITSLCVGDNKEWVVSVDGITITGPFDSGTDILVAALGDVLYYSSGVVTLGTLADYNVGYVNRVEPTLLNDDKRPDQVIAKYLTGGVGGGYAVGDIFHTVRDVSIDEAIPLGSAPLLASDYPELYALLGNSFGGINVDDINLTEFNTVAGMASSNNSFPVVSFNAKSNTILLANASSGYYVYDIDTKTATFKPTSQFATGRVTAMVTVPGTDLTYMCMSSNFMIAVSDTPIGTHGILSQVVNTVTSWTSYTINSMVWVPGGSPGVGKLIVSTINGNANVIVTSPVTDYIDMSTADYSGAGQSLFGLPPKLVSNPVNGDLYLHALGSHASMYKYAPPYNLPPTVVPLGATYNTSSVTWSDALQAFILADSAKSEVLVLDINMDVIDSINTKVSLVSAAPTSDDIIITDNTANSTSVRYKDRGLVNTFMVPPKLNGIPLKETIKTLPTAEFFTPCNLATINPYETIPLTGKFSIVSIPVSGEPTGNIAKARLFALNAVVEENGVAKHTWAKLDGSGRIVTYLKTNNNDPRIPYVESVIKSSVVVNSNGIWIIAPSDGALNSAMTSQFNQATSGIKHINDARVGIGYSYTSPYEGHRLTRDDSVENGNLRLYLSSSPLSLNPPGSLLRLNGTYLAMISFGISNPSALILTTTGLYRANPTSSNYSEVVLSPSFTIDGDYINLSMDSKTGLVYLMTRNESTKTENIYLITGFDTGSNFNSTLIHSVTDGNGMVYLPGVVAVNHGVICRIGSKDGVYGSYITRPMVGNVIYPIGFTSHPSGGTVLHTIETPNGIAVLSSPNYSRTGAFTLKLDVPSPTGTWWTYTLSTTAVNSLQLDWCGRAAGFSHSFMYNAGVVSLNTAHIMSNVSPTDHKYIFTVINLSTGGLNWGISGDRFIQLGSGRGLILVDSPTISHGIQFLASGSAILYLYRYLYSGNVTSVYTFMHGADTLMSGVSTMVYNSDGYGGVTVPHTVYGIHNVWETTQGVVNGGVVDFTLSGGHPLMVKVTPSGDHYVLTSVTCDDYTPKALWRVDSKTKAVDLITEFDNDFIATWVMGDNLYWNREVNGSTNSIFSYEPMTNKVQFIKI
jgi:hypothetical protein